MTLAPVFPPAVLEQHLGIVGKTGSGKTSTAKLAIEQVVADGARVCVLDPVKSDHWGLISSADGKRPGLPFAILGGPHGHVQLSEDAGKAIGELVGRGKLPLSILDMVNFGPGGTQRFFVAFADSLLKNMRGVLHLVLEEAHEFAPKERAGFAQENMALHYAKKLATAGRSKGIRLIVATQRTQSLHNAILGSCETMVVLRLTAPADQEPVIKWLKGNAPADLRSDIIGSLSTLKTGSAWFCSGEAELFERRVFPRIKTFDNSATPTADSSDVKVRAADVDLGALQELVGTAIALVEADDPAALRGRIRYLEGEIARAPVLGNASDDDVKRLENRCAVLEHAVRIRNSELNTRRDFVREVRKVCSEIGDSLATITARLSLSDWPDAGMPDVDAILKRDYPILKGVKTPVVTPEKLAADSSGEIPKGELALLRAAIEYGDAGVARDQLFVLTGYRSTSINEYAGRLRRRGLVGPDWPLVATPEGRNVGRDFAELPRGRALLEHWEKRLPAGELKVLDALMSSCGVGGVGLKPDELRHLTGYKATSANEYVGRLRARRLVERKKGLVYASPMLFD